MGMMNYKGYTARIEYSDEDECFVGHIAGIRDIVGFHAESVAELKAAFHDAVDDYLDTCEKLNKAPQRPFSGNVRLRVTPELHANLATLAEASGKSLNSWVENILEKHVHAHR